MATQRGKYKPVLGSVVGDALRPSLATATTTLALASPVQHIFGNCLGSTSNNLKPLVLLGPTTTCWSLWLSRNDIIFRRRIIFLLLRLYTQLSIGSILGPFSIMDNPATPFVKTHSSSACKVFNIL